MVISQHAISWIQVAGLLMSLYGFFYLTMGFFPGSIRIFRPLLPATGIGLSSFFFLYILLPLIFGSPKSGPEVEILVVFALIPSIIYGVQEYRRAYEKQIDESYPQSERMTMFFKSARDALPMFGCMLLFFVIIVAIISFFMVHQVFTIAQGIVVLFFVPMFINFTLIELVVILSERSLQGIGFILSVIGLLTGFLPAVLDVLGIIIR